jgi:hypothetical protein
MLVDSRWRKAMHDYDATGRTHRLPRAPETGEDPLGVHRRGPEAPPTVRAPHDPASLMHLQRTVGNAGVVQLLSDEAGEETSEESSPVHDVVGKGGGTTLDDSTRSTMEGRFGQDFGDVRVHTDDKASASAESVGANAYTVGNDIVFRSGQFDTATPTGQRTLAHELSHVVQQRSGPVDGTDAPGGIKLSDPTDRFERSADQTASQVMDAPDGAEEEEAATAQRVVQRQETDEELPEEE